MNNKLRILLFSSRGAGTHYFGPGISAYRMYQHMDRDKVSLSLLHGFPGQPEEELFDRQYMISDLTVPGTISTLRFMLKIKKWVQEHSYEFDVVHCLGAFHPSFLVAYYFEKQHVPAFIKITESKHTGFTKSSFLSELTGLKRFRKQNANRITGYISISSEITGKLQEAGIEDKRIYPIPNGVNTVRFKPVPNAEKIHLRTALSLEDRFTVLFTGAFSDRKNPLLIARAFRHFAQNKNIQLLLVGPDSDDGTHRKQIFDYITENKLDNIIVRGEANEIEKYYQASDLFVLPSKEEGLSNSMLEAMACGLPVLVTRVSGAEDVVNHFKNGAFIEANPESIFRAIKSYVEDSKLLKYNSRNATQAIQGGFRSQDVYLQHIRLFKNERRRISTKI